MKSDSSEKCGGKAEILGRQSRIYYLFAYIIQRIRANVLYHAHSTYLLLLLLLLLLLICICRAWRFNVRFGRRSLSEHIVGKRESSGQPDKPDSQRQPGDVSSSWKAMGKRIRPKSPQRPWLDRTLSWQKHGYGLGLESVARNRFHEVTQKRGLMTGTL